MFAKAKVLQWSQSLVQKIMKKHLHTSKCTLVYESPNKDGFRIKSKEQEAFEKLDFKHKVANEAKLWKEVVKQTVTNFKNDLVTGPRVALHEHQLEPVWRFTGKPEELKKWVVTSDKDHNIGFSTAELGFTQHSKGLFHGYLDTKVPRDGVVKRTGFCNAKLIPKQDSFYELEPHDWSLFTHLICHVRGDGRVYSINLHALRYFDVTAYDTWHYFIWTRGGPYWQYVRIPFSKFVFAYKGKLKHEFEKVSLSEIGAISITLADKITGPFHLEIDYIAVEYDPSHIEECAYETYFKSF